MSKTALYEIGSLPNDLLAKKYQVTKGYYFDPKSIENYQKDALSYTGCEKPLFEEDLIRKENVHRSNILSLMEHGSRYSHTPYHPELFLGDITKDDRGAINEPISSKVTEQNRYRHEKYQRGKMQNDNTYNVIEGTVDRKLMSKIVKQGLNNTRTRYGGVFDESVDAAHYRSNPKPGNNTTSIETTISEDQKFYEQGGEKIMSNYSSDPVNNLSNLIGANWQSQPDTKFKVSSVSNLYRAKGEVDESANAVFRLAQQDTDYKIEDGTLVTKQMVQLLDSIREAKKLNSTVEVKLTNDSKKNGFLNKVELLQGNKGGAEIINTKHSHQKKLETYLNQRFLKEHNPNKQIENQGIQTHKSFKRNDKLSNKIIGAPEKDKLKIVKSIVRDNKNFYKDRFTTNYSVNQQIIKNVMANKKKEGIYETTGTYRHKKKEENIKYSQATLSKPEDYVSNRLQTTPGFYKDMKEYMSGNIAPNTSIPMVNIGNFEFDTDPTTDNAYMDRRGGRSNIVSLYKEKVFDNDISELAETTNTSART